MAFRNGIKLSFPDVSPLSSVILSRASFTPGKCFATELYPQIFFFYCFSFQNRVLIHYHAGLAPLIHLPQLSKQLKLQDFPLLARASKVWL